jgi:hypothetical protein
MTEAEWLACTDPQEMLAFLLAHPGYSERKVRLFAVACYWQVEEFHWDEPLFDAEVEAVEDSALQLCTEEADYAAWMAQWAAERSQYAEDGAWPAGAAEAGQADLLRDLFGNPFRPLALDAGSLPPTVRDLAQAAYEERLERNRELDPTRLAILADALEEAGCTEPAVLDHLRGPGPHVRGCWPVDLVLARR